MYDGITGLVADPIRGAREEGTKGAVKGVGKGVMGVYWKTTAALAGLLGYPLQGVYKSVHGAIYSSNRRLVAKARREEGVWMLATAKRKGSVDVQAVLEAGSHLG